MTTWWIIDRDKQATDALLSPIDKQGKLSLPEIVKDVPQRATKASVSFRNISSEDSFEVDSHSMLLPGSIIEELN